MIGEVIHTASFCRPGFPVAGRPDPRLPAGATSSVPVSGNCVREPARGCAGRSEEHTSEPPSLMRISYAVFCLKKKKYENQSQTLSERSYLTNNTNSIRYETTYQP